MKITLVEKGIKSSIDYYRYQRAKYQEISCSIDSQRKKKQ